MINLILPLFIAFDFLFVDIGYLLFVLLVWLRCKRLVMWFAKLALGD